MSQIQKRTKYGNMVFVTTVKMLYSSGAESLLVGCVSVSYKKHAVLDKAITNYCVL